MSIVRNFFGTDGVRGAYGGPVVNEGFAARLGFAAAVWLLREEGRRTCNPGPAGVAKKEEKAGSTSPWARPVVLIGRDTRFSGEALRDALIKGLTAGGCEAKCLGVLPTPALARAVRVGGAALGVVITASHNPATDNGIKFFSAAGRKLSDEEEAELEALLPNVEAAPSPPFSPVGAAGADTSCDDYIRAAASLLPKESLRGWRIVVDTANGATVGTTPTVLAQLGAEVIGLGDRPDGRNINADVGSEHPGAMVARVRETGARLGIAHDGDGDRCVLCDERGEVLDGDEILTLLAVRALAARRLAANTLVVTVHSNLGVDEAVRASGGRVIRTAVGDRYVVEGMERAGATLGGESSGHIVCMEIAPTGDGLVAALKVIEAMLQAGRPLSELRRSLRKFPQASAALPVRAKPPLETLPALTAAIRAAEASLNGAGRVLVRYSGTEPKLRLLVEGAEERLVKEALQSLLTAARAELG